MPPRLHIQFAAGALEGDLEARVGALAETPTEVAWRDLDRYYRLLADELARLRLSAVEATALVAACRGWLVEPTSYRYLWVEVEDYLTGLADDTADGIPEVRALDGGARSVLVAKLRALSPGGALAVCDAVERYWALHHQRQLHADLGIPGAEHSTLLRDAGLVRS